MIKYFLILFFAISLISCAVVRSPQGGPRDSTAPHISYAMPVNKTLNFADDKIILQFDKYMNKAKVVENVFINPSVKMAYDWSGRELEIEFLEKLKENTTYTLQLGTDYSDYLGNKPSSAYSLVFSTGTALDSAKIIGKLFNKESSGKYIFAYKIDNINIDSLNIRKQKPDYRVQIGTNGEFEFQALKNGTYRLFAIEDKFKDELYNVGIDKLSAATQDYLASSSPDEKVHIRLGGERDELKPDLNSAYAFSSQRVIASFSEEIDSLSVLASNFELIDSISRKNISIIAAYSLAKNRKEVEILTGQPLDSNSRYILKANSQYLRDTIGLLLNPAKSSVSLKGTAINEKLELKIVRGFEKDSLREYLPQSGYLVEFNTAVKFEKIRDLITYENLTNKLNVPFSVRSINENSFFIIPDSALLPDKWHRISIKVNQIEAIAANSMKDSITKITFLTPFFKSGANLSGKIIDSVGCSDNLLLTLVSNDAKLSYKIDLQKDKTWKLTNVKEGSYKLEAFCDLNSNGKYDYGNDRPFEFAEPFYYPKVELTVKANWDAENVNFIIRNE